MDASFDLTVNGEVRACARGTSVSEFIAGLGLDPALVVVELNGEILPAGSFAERELKPGDALEVIQFVGGG